jgi:hypothetical protein
MAILEGRLGETVPIKYRAFLSYSHHDTRWAKWLHARLESFRIDKELVGRETPLGPVPKTLRPIFRDREDFSTGHTLTEAPPSLCCARPSRRVGPRLTRKCGYSDRNTPTGP